MSIKTVYSADKTVKDAVFSIKEQLKGFDTNMVLYFASSSYDKESISKEMESEFRGSKVFGCSTSGEITSGLMLKNSIVVMAFDKDTISDVHIEVVQNLKQNVDVDSAFKAFEKYYGESVINMDMDKYVGIVLIDGLSMKEERVMELISAKTDICFVGGSAGDDLKFNETSVFANGKAYSNAAVLALIKSNAKFSIIKTQSFKATGKKLVTTKVDEKSREVYEFNNESAVGAYAKALSVDKVDVQNYFMSNPVGLEVAEDIYVRSPQRTKDNSIVFYCNIMEGMEVKLLESTDMIKDTKKAIYDKQKEMGDIGGIINFHCILRTLELEKNGNTKEYGEIFSNMPTIGFSTYGEAYLGHINQTSTMLAFKKK